MQVLEIEAKPRVEAGGRSGRQMRARHRIPAVLYGHEVKKPQNLSVDERTFEKGLRQVKGDNVLIDLTIEGQERKHRVFLREMQRDPVTGKLIHVDFLGIDETQKHHFSVPIHPVGVAKGIKAGGILDRILRHLEIRCYAKDVPSHIEVDVTEIDLNKSLHVSAIKVPEGVEVLNPTTGVVFKVMMARLAGAMAEPKVEGEEEDLV